MREKKACYNITESEHQRALIEWAEWQSKTMPELKMLFAIPNGGLRRIQTAVRLKKEGVKAGVPDLFLAIPKGPYHGFFIEMKKDGGKLTENQKTWIKALREQGYKAECLVGETNAREAILEYLSLD